MAERVERVERELAGVAAFLAERLPVLLPLAEPTSTVAAPPGVVAATEPSSMVSSSLTEVADEVEAMRKPWGKVG